MFVCLFHSAFASPALFWLFRVSLSVGARFVRLRSAADLSSYNGNYEPINFDNHSIHIGGLP